MLVLYDNVTTLCIFFFQAEDGIRDIGVTGVQTCALPISRHELLSILGGTGEETCPKFVHRVRPFIQSRSLNDLSKTMQKMELVVGKVTEPTRENGQLFPSQSETLKRCKNCKDEISGKKAKRRRITYPELRVNAGAVKPFVQNI